MVKARKENKICNIRQDVTLYDYANSSVSNSRAKKLTTSVSYVVKSELEVKNNWYDDDENQDFETFHNSTENHQEHEKQRRNIVKQRIEKVCNGNEVTDNGNMYPYDIWFLISNYIRPEDVGTFSSICKTSLAVVLSVNFWIALYKRYLRKECLPKEFQPVCILRYFGLRTSVIKALYLMYPPFLSSTRKTFAGIMHPDVLKEKKCIGLSLRKEDKKWCYFFKFKLNNPVSFHRNGNKNQSIIELLNDIYANMEEDHCLLKVISEERVPILPIIGQFLKYVSFSLSKGFCNYRLQLMFGSEIDNFSVRNGPIGGNVLVIDSVSKIIILNWWHPNYVTNGNLPSSDSN